MTLFVLFSSAAARVIFGYSWFTSCPGPKQKPQTAGSAVCATHYQLFTPVRDHVPRCTARYMEHTACDGPECSAVAMPAQVDKLVLGDLGAVWNHEQELFEHCYGRMTVLSANVAVHIPFTMCIVAMFLSTPPVFQFNASGGKSTQEPFFL